MNIIYCGHELVNRTWNVADDMQYKYDTMPAGGMRGRHLYGRAASTHQESVKLRLITVQQRPISLSLKYVLFMYMFTFFDFLSIFRWVYFVLLMPGIYSVVLIIWAYIRALSVMLKSFTLVWFFLGNEPWSHLNFKSLEK